jgi:hypothetical protein
MWDPVYGVPFGISAHSSDTIAGFIGAFRQVRFSPHPPQNLPEAFAVEFELEALVVGVAGVVLGEFDHVMRVAPTKIHGNFGWGGRVIQGARVDRLAGGLACFHF